MTEAALARLQVEVGRRVRAAREAVGLSQQKAAMATGSDFRYFQRLETGKINPTVATLARIADGLGMSLFELLSHEGADERRTGSRRR